MTTLSSCLLMLVCIATSARCLSHKQQSASLFAARRAADDSRQLSRIHPMLSAGQLSADASQEAPIVMGKFKAPAPERFQRRRIPKTSDFGAQTLSASFRVADAEVEATDDSRAIFGSASAFAPRRQAANSNQRQVSAKMQVSDEGLNYPPSKLSADIYGNVAEIVTAPPEAVESDFLMPTNKMFGSGSG